MNKIGTHNSATGEKSASWFDRLLLPFARCQSKSISEQYNHGCRYFDIRYKWSDKRSCYVCGHGWWTSNRTLSDVLREIDDLGKCYVMLTCEHGAPLPRTAIRHILDNHVNICFTTFNRKKPRWKNDYCNQPLKHINGYKVLDGSSWHTFLPIPRLWKWVFKTPPLREDVHTFIDFL